MKSLLKRSFMQKFLCLALALVLAVGFAPLPAQASTERYVYKTISPKQNTYITGKGEAYSYNSDTGVSTTTFYLYKMTVPSAGFIRIQTTTPSKLMCLYRSINRSKSLWDSNSIAGFDGKKLYYRVLPKGTYYLAVESSTRFRWTFIKFAPTSNYCRTRATALSAGQTKTIVYNYGYEFSKWYKVVLPTRKTITVTFKSLDDYYPDFEVFNYRGLYIRCPELTATSYRTAILPKGTYYIRVNRHYDYDDYDYYNERICQLTWR